MQGPRSYERRKKNKGPHMVLKMITWVVLMKKKPAAEGAYNRGEQDEQVVHIYETIQGDYSIP
jgi:hypothetical protein